MKIIWTFTLMMIPGVVSSMSVTGYSGGGVNITCEYDKGCTENIKSFCKGEWLSCIDRIRTDIKDKWFNNGRFSLYDDRRSAVFTVTFRDLTEEDSGMYYCGVDIPKGIDFYTEVNLDVIKKQTTAQPLSTSSSSSSSSLVSLSVGPAAGWLVWLGITVACVTFIIIITVIILYKIQKKRINCRSAIHEYENEPRTDPRTDPSEGTYTSLDLNTRSSDLYNTLTTVHPRPAVHQSGFSGYENRSISQVFSISSKIKKMSSVVNL